jgi:hypothetical protein
MPPSSLLDDGEALAAAAVVRPAEKMRSRTRSQRLRLLLLFACTAAAASGRRLLRGAGQPPRPPRAAEVAPVELPLAVRELHPSPAEGVVPRPRGGREVVTADVQSLPFRTQSRSLGLVTGSARSRTSELSSSMLSSWLLSLLSCIAPTESINRTTQRQQFGGGEQDGGDD